MEEILPRKCIRTLRLLAALILLITIQVILYNRRVYLQLNTSHSPAAKGVRELVIKPFRWKKKSVFSFQTIKNYFQRRTDYLGSVIIQNFILWGSQENLIVNSKESLILLFKYISDSELIWICIIKSIEREWIYWLKIAEIPRTVWENEIYLTCLQHLNVLLWSKTGIKAYSIVSEDIEGSPEVLLSICFKFIF